VWPPRHAPLLRAADGAEAEAEAEEGAAARENGSKARVAELRVLLDESVRRRVAGVRRAWAAPPAEGAGGAAQGPAALDGAAVPPSPPSY
jgi:hypothetical protein